MQKIYALFIIIISLHTIEINAQVQEPCQSPEVTADYLKNENLVFKSSEAPYYLRMKFFVITDSDGNGGRSQEEIYRAFGNLQEVFNQEDIYFSFEGMESIERCDWYNDVFFEGNKNVVSESLQVLANEEGVTNDHINVFVLPQYFPEPDVLESYALSLIHI